MACMFTMMNRARLAVGLQGVGIAERAIQQALAYARERKQGRTQAGRRTAPIIHHPDVKRMLLTMRALTGAARAICYATAVALDRAEREQGRRGAQGGARTRFAAHAGRQGILHRHRHRSRFPRRAGAWRHGLHRGDRRRAASIATRASPRSTKAPTASRRIDLVTRKVPLAGGETVARISTNCAAWSRRSKRATIPPSAGPACGLARRSKAWRARPHGC